jgi:drug/metabolite transporter (DMT)-like permease
METGKDKEERVSKGAWIAMIAIVVGLVVVAAYANWQNAIAIRLRVRPSPALPRNLRLADTLSRVGLT